ncbi:Isochorismate synthase MenF [Rhodopseudomonas palustris]|uniref:Anthranilate synthase n=1 Tax=Rhodopseudomonas palustris (strain ATCC BAA-98 / CGA009) TaxID=258594 RepID=Q6N1B0_RHOPA|nr:anthranilate synthase component I [Rhodopseudomonas palustris]OPF96079.1 anthranilate synthase component I [Rhodopseudomonas palustris]QQM06070.1 Isochorismate synthase MenF [Rhodopseudomonas palustris]RJF66666.1 anthranilate synthase component I [Rhodopseudomonas palustris]WAB77388.1 anthranilate synthase component I [Rhodopseudomonas palustris]WCL94698.1 anthranilate synthase component I [Rhodopseudomonas palustris CGA009]
MNRTVFSLPATSDYKTAAGLAVTRSAQPFAGGQALDELIDLLDHRRGVMLSSGTTVPGRYESFDLGFADPPLALTTRAEKFTIEALNPRGRVLIAFLSDKLEEPCVVVEQACATKIRGHIVRGEAPVDEEQRTRRASAISLVRAVIAAFASPADPMLGLYGAFAYDLVFQFEDLKQKRAREADQRDIVLYVPDRLLAYDRATGRGVDISYEFAWKGQSTAGLPNETAESVYTQTGRQGFADHAPGDYPKVVEKARAAFARGDLFEAVPGQLFGEPCERSPAEVFKRLCRINPSPYGGLLNLGDGEFLVSASPEMFVRSDGRRIETCPISGTIARGVDAISDAEQIQKLLNSEKDEFELNMCTDVDRNDKARVCVPGTIKVLARRQIETYSKLFHTVDHVEGMLRPGFDALDAFLTHAWAVTVTGAPKLWAMQFVEDHERSPRRWYAGAFGVVGFDGSINTGLTIRTIRMKDGLAEVRVGATCLFDSNPVAEDKECQVKAAALFQALRGDPAKPLSAVAPDATGSGKKVLLVDHDDSFVHMLADYFRQVGAQVTVVRYVHGLKMLAENSYDLLVLSPGPGRPEDFKIKDTIDAALAKKLPIFGVCLGVQAMGEYFGGTLGQLAQPAHGRPSRIQVRGGALMRGLPNEVTIGRYHSLYVDMRDMPKELTVTASTDDGIAMAIEHKTLPVGGVQFHPESLMSLGGEVGLRIVENAFRLGQAA